MTPRPPSIDLTRPLADLAAEHGVGVRTVMRWRREAGVVVRVGHPGGSACDIPRTRLLLLRIAGVTEVRELTTDERQRVRAVLGVSRQRLHEAWGEGVTTRTLKRWESLTRKKVS